MNNLIINKNKTMEIDNKEISAEVKKRIEEFHKDLVELIKKHKLDLVAGMKYTDLGIIPVIKIVEAENQDAQVDQVLTK